MKYLLSTLISLVIAIVLALAISSYHKEKWELNLFYSHVINTYNVDYKILDIDLELNSKKEFTDFINRVDGEISIIGANENACAQIRASSTAPSILVMNRNDKLRIDVMSHDKQEVLDCEKVIQKLILNFENYIKQIVLQKMSMPISTDENGIIDLRVLIDNEKQKFKLQPEVEEAYKKLKSTLSQINENDDFYSFNVAKTKQILEGMYTIEKMKKDSDVSSYPFRIDSALQEIVIKEGRLLRSKKQNSLAVGISIFLIIQTIFIMIMISRNEILKKKISKTLQKLSN
jgi:hypothetical protein